MSKKPLTIGVTAKEASVGVETIRYYQRIGLIEQPRKPVSGYRLYSADTVTRLRFIQRAKALGFSLDEISILLLPGDSKCIEIQTLASRKLGIIKSKIHDLNAMAATLENLIHSCESNSPDQICPIIDAIAQSENKEPT